MDSDTGEIVSWASSPTFDPGNIEEYLYQNGDCLINKVSQVSYAPGSVFKIVTAAAALEAGICTINQEFECKGRATVYGITLGCATAQEGGHGVINMKDAMAYSCNCYFAKLGELVGVEAILEMAEKLGLGEKTLLNFPEESAGNIPDETEVGLWDTSNISIGQGEILTTPLQIAVMTSIIANGGKIIKPKILLAENTYSNQVLSKETASSISEMLGAVMIYGTGKSSWSTDVYGKTGTAETSTDEKNCWFTGYYALGEKTYVITIMAEDGVSGTTTCLPVFKKIVKALEELY
jgi:cell division protein FtsI/penicillin-binding protein 2